LAVLLTSGSVFQIGSRQITPVGTAIVLVFAGLVAVRVLRMSARWILLALPGAYAARRLGLDTGLIKWIDHQVLEKVSERFDNVESWLIALGTAVAALAIAGRRERAR
jgi:hypothetical protein